MKIILLFAFLFSATGEPKWQTDFEAAARQAKEEHKLILLNFSGSDWCGPCIRLHSTFFTSPSFTALASDELVLVNADFPRLKKNRLPNAQQKKNDALAERYNQKGAFPLTLLLNEEGRVLHTWEGVPNTTPEAFTDQLKAACHAAK
ncbi:thioredoxin family protein [Parasegetibacter sp. NRK P23]|uniref:thioredoxin family protein n=1 Tax=Parasegetibacter sp. NRK P23 TaxID=2942999 RepID=UPI002043F1AD|nr:thioredoxin family protein [Parasegetibacter sp. NRK P23]MCM5529668.1 thioredoxin family protein [Parasegetibacter sp. NRK P23]